MIKKILENPLILRLRNYISVAKVMFIISAVLLTASTTFVMVTQQDMRSFASETSSVIPLQPKLSDYWNGKAEWREIRSYSFSDYPSSPMLGGNKIIAVGDTWYFFTRKTVLGVAKCSTWGGNFSSTYVKKSTDKGISWSEPVEIIPSVPGSAWDCAATDGDVYYNATTNTWHFYAQCLGQIGTWNGCHFTRSGQSPMGIFTPSPQNPTIKGGDVWKKICTDSTKDCFKIAGGNNVHDAGTFNIFHFDGTYYYVSFHGYDGVNGYRAIAKTTNFVDWIAGDSSQNVPSDSVLDKYDLQNWRERWVNNSPIGFGHASTLYEDGYFYTFAEGSDMNLACIDGQNWDIGFFRTASLTSVNWEQYPQGNPVIYSNKTLKSNGKTYGCDGAYVGLFKDPTSNKYYMYYTRLSEDPAKFATHLFELVDTTNLIQNGNAWTCDGSGWMSLHANNATTQFTAERYTDKSTDDNCYFKVKCSNSTCEAGQSVYQDIVLSSKADIEFGGKFSSPQPSSGYLYLFQLSSSGRIIKSDYIALSTNGTFQKVSKKVVIDPETKTIRYQVYPQAEMYLDELYATQGNGAKNPTPTFTPTVTPTKSSCDPVPNGAIDNDDLELWKKEYKKEVTTTLTACLHPDNVVDLLDFQVWKDIAVYKLR